MKEKPKEYPLHGYLIENPTKLVITEVEPEKCEHCGKEGKKRYICVGVKCEECWENRYNKED